MSLSSLTAFVTVVAVGLSWAGPRRRAGSGPGRRGRGVDVDMASHSGWPAGPTGLLDDPNLYAPGATRLPGRE